MRTESLHSYPRTQQRIEITKSSSSHCMQASERFEITSHRSHHVHFDESTHSYPNVYRKGRVSAYLPCSLSIGAHIYSALQRHSLTLFSPSPCWMRLDNASKATQNDHYPAVATSEQLVREQFTASPSSIVERHPISLMNPAPVSCSCASKASSLHTSAPLTQKHLGTFKMPFF
jgi:hypothetical protein